MRPQVLITSVTCGLCWGLAATLPWGCLLVPAGALALVWWRHDGVLPAVLASVVASLTTYALALHWLPSAFARFAPAQDLGWTVLVLTLPLQILPTVAAVTLAQRQDTPWSWMLAFAATSAIAEWVQPLPSGPSLFMAEAWWWLWPAALVGRAGLDGLLLGWARLCLEQPSHGAATLIITTAVGLGLAQVPQQPLGPTMAILQPNIDPDLVQLPSQRAVRGERLLALADVAQQRGASLAIAPEGGWPEDPGPESSTRRLLFEQSWRQRLPTVLGVHAKVDSGRVNRLVHSHHPSRRVDKQILVPVAERQVLGLGRDRFHSNPGPRILAHEHLELAGLICYEDLFPTAVMAAASADLVICAAHDGWTSRNTGSRLHLNASRLVAVETGRWVARPTTNGRSAWIGPSGRSGWETPWMVDDGHGLTGLWAPGVGRASLGARLGPWLWLLVLPLLWRRDEH